MRPASTHIQDLEPPYLSSVHGRLRPAANTGSVAKENKPCEGGELATRATDSTEQETISQKTVVIRETLKESCRDVQPWPASEGERERGRRSIAGSINPSQLLVAKTIDQAAH